MAILLGNDGFHLFYFLLQLKLKYCTLLLFSWLEKITEQPSGLDFVDAPNKSILVGYNEKVAFDLSGIVDFPGFNAPLEQRYRDVGSFYKLLHFFLLL